MLFLDTHYENNKVTATTQSIWRK